MDCESRWPTFARLIKFCLVGATGTVVDLLTVAKQYRELPAAHGWSTLV